MKCVNKKCTAFNPDYEFNCYINGFTSSIGCKQYKTSDDLVNDDKVLSVVADKLIESGVLNAK